MEAFVLKKWRFGKINHNLNLLRCLNFLKHIVNRKKYIFEKWESRSASVNDKDIIDVYVILKQLPVSLSGALYVMINTVIQTINNMICWCNDTSDFVDLSLNI